MTRETLNSAAGADDRRGSQSPHGWWLASYLLRAEWDGESRHNPNRRCLAWENTIILRAKDREEAFTKVIALGEMDSRIEMREEGGLRKGNWRFEGLTELLPIYEKLEDGAEILWKEHKGRTVRTIKSWVRDKRELAAFRDK
jgi:hypothetical protein